jgi:radical SAM superfamily enzyme YgiQ (UPF0313 family)
MSNHRAPPPQVAGLRSPGAILLISCYELGHQPLGLASPLAFLEQAGFNAEALDVAIERVNVGRLERARFIGVAVPMHTALRMGLRLMERIRHVNPGCHVCFYGLYASLNEDHLFGAGGGGADSVIGGEYELPLLRLIEALSAGLPADGIEGVSLPGRPARPLIKRLPFVAPKRDALPPLSRYARLDDDGVERLAGYVEATHGCLHRCRHCPITPVYDGRFVAVPADVVLEDVRRQVRMGATHMSFGDPDFLNGPRHSLRIARAAHAEFPDLTFDFTTKVEHILAHRSVFSELRALGGIFVVSAFESLNDEILTHLDKGHTRADAEEALRIIRGAGMTLRPTWVPFTPWTSLDEFVDILEFVERQDLVECVAPVQYTIRLLVPPGSALLDLPAMRQHLGPLDPAALTYAWSHPDPRVDRLQRAVAAQVTAAETQGKDAAATFAVVKQLALEAAGRRAEAASGPRVGSHRRRARPPRLTEAWFC